MKTIPLTQNYFAIVDDEDFERVSRHKWHVARIQKCVYAKRRINIEGQPSHELMHHFIFGKPPGKMVDHRDRNGCNNTRANLRIADHVRNGQNRSIDARNTSGVSGVSFHKKKAMWRAMAGRVFLGWFSDFNDAVAARRAAEQRIFGEFAATP